nr:hypothetical protein [Micromonospora sp. DSM 115978]
QAVAHVLAAAVERALADRELRRLYAAAGRARRWLAAPAEVTAAVVAAADSGRAFALVAKIARAVTAADVCVVALSDESGRLVVSAADVGPQLGVDVEQLRATRVRLDRVDPTVALRSGPALLVDRL